MADLRLTISLSGGASLGAYQAGACAALLTALGRLREDGVDVRLDATGGASAGAIVGLMAAQTVLGGLDPGEVMHTAWVERVDIGTLLRRGSRGPLSLEEVRGELPGVLRDAPRVHPPQEHPVVLHAALTGLRGLTYRIPGVRDGESMTAVTYADWKDFRLEPGRGVDQLLEPQGASPMETVIASASHPGAFAPRVLDRGEDRDAYESQGLSNLPGSGWLWYTDGGLVHHEPIGRLLAAGSAVDDGSDDAHRLALMIHPRSKEPTDAEEWSDRDYEASWAEGLSRGLAVVSEQPLYDDLRKLARDNARLEWLERLVATLAPRLDDVTADELRALIDAMADDREERREGHGEEVADAPGEDASAEAVLEHALRDVAGLGGKHRHAVDLISPLLMAERAGEDVSDLLAGELMGDFGGFLQHDLRESDYALGYESALCWAQDGLEACGVPAEAAARAVEAIEDARRAEWREVRQGRSSERDLPWRARLRLAHFLLRMVRALVR